MTCSLIVTTYNWKEALELVLLSALNQTILPDEIIVADDGSKEDTQLLISNFSKQFSHIPIIHSWQEDNGFRAAHSRNKAIAIAQCTYIVLVDGDMILHRSFIEEHKKYAEKGYFIQGSRVLISQNKSSQILKNKRYELSFYTLGLYNRKNALHSNVLSSFFLQKINSLKGIKTCNMSFFRNDCISINGFNEDFTGWGREDSEFCVRLMNYGIKRKTIRFNCIAYHIWHKENKRNCLPRNDMLLQQSMQENATCCINGIANHLGEP